MEANNMKWCKYPDEKPKCGQRICIYTKERQSFEWKGFIVGFIEHAGDSIIFTPFSDCSSSTHSVEINYPYYKPVFLWIPLEELESTLPKQG